MSCIIVLGMHRSGTSCLTGCLQAHGLYLGEVNNAAPFNKKGNKENSQTWAINDHVLQLSDGAWDVPPNQLRWNDEAKNMRADFLSQYEAKHTWGFKDPRTMLTLPFWLEALDDRQFVATFRHPLLVAKSLESRNGFSTERSLALWLTYNQLLLDYDRQFGIPMVSYDAPQVQYTQAVVKMAAYLELPLSETSANSFFYDATLQHQTMDGINTTALPTEVADMYAELCDRAAIWLQQ